jgi:hypothetical protein
MMDFSIFKKMRKIIIIFKVDEFFGVCIKITPPSCCWWKHSLKFMDANNKHFHVDWSISRSVSNSNRMRILIVIIIIRLFVCFPSFLVVLVPPHTNTQLLCYVCVCVWLLLIPLLWHVLCVCVCLLMRAFFKLLCLFMSSHCLVRLAFID